MSAMRWLSCLRTTPLATVPGSRWNSTSQCALLVQRESAAEPPQGALGLPTEQRLIDPEQLTVVGQHADVLLEFLGGDHWWRSGSGVVVDTH